VGPRSYWPPGERCHLQGITLRNIYENHGGQHRADEPELLFVMIIPFPPRHASLHSSGDRTGKPGHVGAAVAPARFVILHHWIGRNGTLHLLVLDYGNPNEEGCARDDR